METNPNIINFSSSSSPIINPSKPLPNHRIVDEFWKKFPVGYRFCPQDGELILHYLKKKLDDWVLCKIYYKPSRSCKARNAEEEEEGDPQRTLCDENIPRLTTDTQSGGDVMVSSNEEVETSNGMNKKESESGFEDDHNWSYINPDSSGFGWQQVDWINNANNYNNPYMNIDDFRPPLFK
ncbi:hypothetical protein LWI29_018997 [Acer saccharum]|uniref:NAC domain-containing protein n=1 Tax=Acer saccharum TaxID=4024 RepID=A0AA39RDF5_ACESA|nr:hypothetical protein LWI29_018997 [Acer saccharum]